MKQLLMLIVAAIVVIANRNNTTTDEPKDEEIAAVYNQTGITDDAERMDTTTKYFLSCPGLRTYSFTRALAERLKTYRIKPLSPRIAVDIAVNRSVDIGCVRFDHLSFNINSSSKDPIAKGCQKPLSIIPNMVTDITCQVVVDNMSLVSHIFTPTDKSIIKNFGMYYQTHGVCGADWQPCMLAPNKSSSQDPGKITRYFFQFPPNPNPAIHDGVWRISIFNSLQQRFVMDKTCAVSFLPYGKFPGDNLSMLNKAVERFDLAVQNTITFLNTNVSGVAGCNVEDASINH